MSGHISSFNFIKSSPMIFYCFVLGLSLLQLCLATDEQGNSKEKRSLLSLLFGPRPLPGDVTSPAVCENVCRNRCLSGGGFGGFLGVPGCNQFCDCSFYLGGGGGFW